MHISMHWGSDTLTQEVSLLPPQPRMEGTAFLGRQKTSLVGTWMLFQRLEHF